MSPRGRWVVDEATGELVERPLPEKDPKETDEERRVREREERDAHPGLYL